MLAAGLFAAQANANGGVTEPSLEMGELPSAVASSFQSELEGRSVGEIEEISYEGIVVLYEVEYEENGEAHEIYARPDGEVAARHSH